MHYNQKALKLIALITMFIDHAAVCFFHQLPYSTYTIMRNIGRLTFPIYIFLAIEAVMYTHSKKKYLMRLLLLAFISELPFDLAIFHRTYYPEYQNVIFTILFGACSCICFPKAIDTFKTSKLKALPYFLLTAACLFLPYYFKTDYSSGGAAAIFIGYLIKKYSNIKNIRAMNVLVFLSVSIILLIDSDPSEAFSLITPLFAIPYNEKTGKVSSPEKYAYRFYYPAHLLFIWIIYYFSVYVNMPHYRIG